MNRDRSKYSGATTFFLDQPTAHPPDGEWELLGRLKSYSLYIFLTDILIFDADLQKNVCLKFVAYGIYSIGHT